MPTKKQTQSTAVAHRDRLIAMYAGMGWQSVTIAKELKIASRTVNKVLEMPEVKLFVQSYQEQYFASKAKTLEQEVLADGQATFTRLKQIRDNPDDEISIKAIPHLWDRQMPKRSIHEEDHTIRIILSKEQQSDAKTIMAEARLIDDYAPQT
jgi:hypothetical protein